MKEFQIKEYSLIPPPYGGASVFLRRLIDRLNEDGYKVGGYYSPENKESEIVNSPLFDLFDYDGSETKILRLLRHIRRIYRAAKKYDVIHIHGQEMICLCALAHLLLRQKIVVSVHNSMLGDYYYRMAAFDRWGFNYLARKKDVVWIAVSSQAREELLKLPVQYGTPIFVIPAFVPDISAVEALPKPLSEYIASHKKNISFYGRSFMVHEEQDVYGFKDIIRLYCSVVDAYNDTVGLVLCISETSNALEIQKLKAYAKALGVDKRIYWQLGGIKGIRALWQASDVYIRPTSTDGDSVSVRDALAEGVRVVASDVCTRPEGVFTYRFGDDSDLKEKTFFALNIEDREERREDSFYIQMKEIYDRLLQGGCY